MENETRTGTKSESYLATVIDIIKGAGAGKVYIRQHALDLVFLRDKEWIDNSIDSFVMSLDQMTCPGFTLDEQAEQQIKTLMAMEVINYHLANAGRPIL